VQLERAVGSKTAKRYLCSLKQLAPWLEGALSSIMNFAVLQGWIDVNTVVPKLALVPERRDPILLPTDRDIALVIERAPGMVGQMVMAALKTGAREDELVRAKRVDLVHSRK
jgi:integrase/recombinase XerD